MGEPSFGRFQHGNLDPQAQEFVPRTNIVFSTTPGMVLPPPPPPLPPPHHVFYTLPPPQTVPFNEVIVLSYHHQQQQQQYPLSPATYIRALPLPPESSSPTRTVTLTSVPPDLSEALVRKELEVFGQVRGLEMERIHDGIVTVHFYDLRHAERALNDIRNQHMQHQARLGNIFARNMGHEAGFVSSHIVPPTAPGLGIFAGCAVWAQFAIPSCTSVLDGQNQGTIVVFNLDPKVSAGLLRNIFQTYGAVKEVRETPMKKQQRFVEFYDVRDAARALKEMNGKEIRGKEVVIEFSRPGGYGRKFLNGNTSNTSFSLSSYNSTDNAKMYKHGLHHNQPSLPRGYSCFLHAEDNASPRHHRPVSEPSSSAKRCLSDEEPVEVSVSGLSVSGGDNADVSEKDIDVASKRNAKSKAQNAQANAGVKHQQRLKPWKGKQAKKLDARFLINEEAMVESHFNTDTRTTVMIKNIPNKYSQKLLLNMLDNHCIHCNEQIMEGDGGQPLSSYDFVYLPIDFNNKCNVGYGFVNMTSPQATWRLYKAFHHQHWEVFNSRKICEVTYARVQGLDALKEHFKNSKFPCEMEHYLPVIFSPPRDGKQQTEPTPIVCHKPIISALPSPNDIDKTNSPRNTNQYDNNTDQDQEDGEAMMDCSNSSSCSQRQNGGDMCYDDDDGKAIA